MAKFEDTPNWKRKLVWDPERERMMPPPRPPTRKQLRYLIGLCAQLQIRYVEPRTRLEAAETIARYRRRLNRRRLRRRLRKRKRQQIEE